MAEIEDLTGFGGAAEKLAETLYGVASIVIEPARIRRVAQAQADAAVIKARGEAAAAEVMLRAQDRINRREARRQWNLEQIAAKAVPQLPAAVSNTPVNEDWLADFLNSAQDVGDDDLQTVWARILAGEVTSPGSFSRRALAVVRLLSREDAELFTKLCQYVWRIGLTYFHCPAGRESSDPLSYLEGTGIDALAFRHLDEIGLTLYTPVGMSVTILPTGTPTPIEYFGRVFAVSVAREQSLIVVPLSSVGGELVRIAGSTPNEEYFSACLGLFAARGINCTPVGGNHKPEMPRNTTSAAGET